MFITMSHRFLVHAITPLSKLYFNITLYICLTISVLQQIICIIYHHKACYTPTHFIFLNLITLNNTGQYHQTEAEETD
jgi:hypothetical protein